MTNQGTNLQHNKHRQKPNIANTKRTSKSREKDQQPDRKNRQEIAIKSFKRRNVNGP